MVEKGLNLEFTDVYGKLKNLQNTDERVSKEHLHFYDCYVNQVKSAVTHLDKNVARLHLGDAQNWFEAKVDGTRFRNQTKGGEQDYLDEVFEDKIATKRAI